MAEETSIARVIRVFYEALEPCFYDSDADFISYAFHRIATGGDLLYETMPELEEEILEAQLEKEESGSDSVPFHDVGLQYPEDELGVDEYELIIDAVHHIGVQYPEEEELGVDDDDDEHIIDIPDVRHIGFQYPSRYDVAPPVLVRSNWWYTLGDNPYVVLALFTVGAICAFASPVFYIRDIVAWW